MSQQGSITYPWYAIIEPEDPLEQGDIFRGFPIVDPPTLSNTPTADNQIIETEDLVKLYDVIIMTQSCDLENDKITDDDYVVLCAVYDAATAETRTGGKYTSKSTWSSLVKGYTIHVHPLNKCEIKHYEFNYQIVDMRLIFSIPLRFVKEVAAQQARIRLLSPYREHLSQAFARIFMRIGLPHDLPREYPKTLDS